MSTVPEISYRLDERKGAKACGMNSEDLDEMKSSRVYSFGAKFIHNVSLKPVNSSRKIGPKYKANLSYIQRKKTEEVETHSETLYKLKCSNFNEVDPYMSVRSDADVNQQNKYSRIVLNKGKPSLNSLCTAAPYQSGKTSINSRPLINLNSLNLKAPIPGSLNALIKRKMDVPIILSLQQFKKLRKEGHSSFSTAHPKPILMSRGASRDSPVGHRMINCSLWAASRKRVSFARNVVTYEYRR